MKIERGRRVKLKVHLEKAGGGLIEDGEVEYVHGAGAMLAGLESAIEGLEAGASKAGVIPAAHAFGDPAKQPEKTIRRAEFAAKADNGQPVVLEVRALQDDQIVVRLVHPLAKSDIEYKVTVLAVWDRKPPPLPADAVVDAE
jgi:FKBP-type peptidyl-prolyl cis-trans isomerase 2